MKKVLSLIVLVFLCLTFITASSYTFAKDDIINFRFRCFDVNNSYCNSETTCQISTEDPDGINVFDNESMTYNPTYFNFTLNTSKLGTYTNIILCENATSTFPYIVTQNGKPSPEGITIVVFSAFFLIILFGAILSLLKTLAHWRDLNVDIIDVSLNLGLYFVIFAFYYLSIQYLGNALIEDLLLLAIRVGAITHVLSPLFAFATSLIFNPLKIKERENA